MTSPTPTLRRARGLVHGLFAAAVLAACGGGGSTATDAATPAASGGPTASAYAAGPITGFGSVIVNGVRFDDSVARVADDDDASRSRDDLRLGMMAEVLSAGTTTDTTGTHASASEIRFRSELVGPVASIASDGSALVVLGETVKITTSTLFDDRLVGGLAGLTVGSSIVEVHGVLDAATGTYTASRIEPKTNPPFFKLRGPVASIDKVAHTFRIAGGTDTVSYDAIAATVPAALDNGALVRVRLQTTQVGGRWIAAAVTTGVRPIADHAEAELEGAITATTFAVDKKFSVNGVAVDASGATFPTGTAGIVLGARVEVKGSVTAGVLIATRVSVETERERELRGFELHGALSALDTTAKTFVLRGVTVNYGGTGVVFRKGTAADLANGRKVEVEGTRSTDGASLVATRIGFED